MSKTKPVCAVCGQGGYWVAWLSVAQEYRCANHLDHELELEVPC